MPRAWRFQANTHIQMKITRLNQQTVVPAHEIRLQRAARLMMRAAKSTACPGGSGCQLETCDSDRPTVEIIDGLRVIEAAPNECADCRLHRALHHDPLQLERDIEAEILLAELRAIETRGDIDRGTKRRLVAKIVDREAFTDHEGRWGDLC